MARKTIGVLWLCVLLCLSSTVHAQTTGTVTYVYADHQGTPLAEADAQGNITATYDYQPYGAQALGTPPNGPGYTGHVNDPDTGLVYMQARYYDPALGRFLSIDPVSPGGGNAFNFNRYAYAANNPIAHIDPDGRQYGETEAEVENRMNDPAVAAGELQASQRATPMAVGLVPVVGDAQNIAEAVHNPTPANIAIAAIGAIPEIGGEAAAMIKEARAAERAGAEAKTYQTYTKANASTGEVYSGRTSGIGTPEANVAARDNGHHMNEQGFGPATLDKSSSNKDAIRGREQQLIDANGGAKSQGGTSGNAINGVSPSNPKAGDYTSALNDPANFHE